MSNPDSTPLKDAATTLEAALLAGGILEEAPPENSRERLATDEMFGNIMGLMAESLEKSQAGGDATVAQRDAAEPFHKLEKRIFNGVGRAISDFKLIDQGDKILVAVSGGKDSWVLLDILRELQKRAPVDFELIAVNIDQGYAGFRQDVVEDYLNDRGIPFFMEDFNIAQIIAEKNQPGSTPCSLCSRLRRGSLYGLAEKLGCNKIALGHHLDDLVETLLLNLFFIGRLGSMAPKLKADDGKNIVIRPLVYVQERDIIAYSREKKFPIVCCQCPLMCGETVHGDYKRRMVKKLINTLEVRFPEIKNSMIASLGRVMPTHLLDTKLENFEWR